MRVGGRIHGQPDHLEAAGWTHTIHQGEHNLARLEWRRLLENGARLSVVPAGEHGRHNVAFVEGSAPKIETGSNVIAFPLDRAITTAEAWHELAGEWVTWDEPARLNRLDVVRDFKVGDALAVVLGGLTEGAGDVPRMSRAQYLDHRTDGQGLWVSNTRGGGRLYDKGRESGEEAGRGIIRFEAQERAGRLRGAGIKYLESATRERVEGLARDRFAACGFHVPVTEAADVLGRLREVAGEGMALQAFAWMMLPGAARQDLQRDRRRRLRRLLEVAGVPGEGIEAATGARSVRLDWDQGLIAA